MEQQDAAKREVKDSLKEYARGRGQCGTTEEIVVIVVGAEPVHILAMALVSLVQSAVVLFFSNFRGPPQASSNLFFEMSLVHA